jgi:hypothetical protein
VDCLIIPEVSLDERRRRLPQRLRRLASDATYMQARYQSVSTHLKALAIHQGQTGDLPYTDWRVSLPAVRLSVGYFEVWRYYGRPQQQRHGIRHPNGATFYQLEKAYLHLYLPMPEGPEKAIVFLHCDPQEPPENEHHRYKVAPHVHFEVADSPWRAAHVPLCDGWQNQVLADADSLDCAIGRAIDFIADQIIPLAPRR